MFWGRGKRFLHHVCELGVLVLSTGSWSQCFWLSSLALRLFAFCVPFVRETSQTRGSCMGLTGSLLHHEGVGDHTFL